MPMESAAAEFIECDLTGLGLFHGAYLFQADFQTSQVVRGNDPRHTAVGDFGQKHLKSGRINGEETGLQINGSVSGWRWGRKGPIIVEGFGDMRPGWRFTHGNCDGC